MSIMRSFTNRRKAEFDSISSSFVGRAASQRGGRSIQRTQISSPMCLVSTTNMLSYNAPDIAGTAPVENRELAASSSSEESDGSGGSTHSHETDPTDLSSPEASPVSVEPEPNHLSQYFKAALDPASRSIRSASVVSRSPQMTQSPSPALPRRAPSHSKHAHEALSRKLSVQRALSPPPVRGRSVSHIRDSADMFSSMATAFVEAPKDTVGQLDAVNEELGGSATTSYGNDSDASYLRRKGLAAISAADYCSEVDVLKAIYLYGNSPTMSGGSDWI